MASITCYTHANYGDPHQHYDTNQPDITGDFPNGVGSAKVHGDDVIVFELTNYKGASATLEVGKYPDSSSFPSGNFKSLKVTK